MTTQAWKEVFDHIRYNPDPMTPILERVHRANAERLERQAERLIKRGYRVEELVNVQMAAWMQDPPMVIGGKEITVPPWGNIEPKENGPSWSVLALRRLGRMVRPYKVTLGWNPRIGGESTDGVMTWTNVGPAPKEDKNL